MWNKKACGSIYDEKFVKVFPVQPLNYGDLVAKVMI